jgi:predicted nucleic-acid-binding protein
MPALDTNVLVRYLVLDEDVAQHARATDLIERVAASGQTLFVPVTVALELEWVLRSSFGFAKDEVVQTLADLLGASEFTFESEAAIEYALVLYRDASADFSDCIHIALVAQAGEAPLWTFDKKAAKVSGAQALA